LLSGCSGRPREKSYPVSGTVTFDGKPLPDGEIYFLGAKGDVQTLAIKNGTFSGQVGEGSRKVQIVAYRLGKSAAAESGMTGGMYDQPTKENYIPAKYNAQSTLSAEVKAAGPNQFKFDLVSEGAPGAPEPTAKAEATAKGEPEKKEGK